MILRSTSLGLLAATMLSLAPAMTNAQDDAAKTKATANDDPMGYFLGVSVGQTMLQQGFKAGDFKPSALAAGVVDALAERDIALDDEQLKEVQGEIQGLLRSRQETMMAERKKAAALNTIAMTMRRRSNLAKPAK